MLARKGRTLITENAHRPGPGRGRCRRLQRRIHRTGPAACNPDASAAALRCGAARAARGHRRRDHHRHHGPGVAQRPGRLRDRRCWPDRSTRLRRITRPARQRAHRHRDRGRRRDRRRGRPRQGQADRHSGCGRARPGVAGQRIQRPHPAAPGEEDLFWLGTEEAIALGRAQAQLLRRSVRRFSDEPVTPELVEAAVAEALTAPAPHHTRPVRFVWMQDPTARVRLLDRMKEQWRADLTGDGKPPSQSSVVSAVARSSTPHPNW